MQNWQKYRNFRKTENTDGSFTYTIKVDGEMVEVNEELYTAYASAGYKMENTEIGSKRDRVLQDANGKAVRDEHGQPVILPEREVSLNKLIDEGWDYPQSASSPEAIFFAAAFSEDAELSRCLALLTDGERALVNALYFEGLTETEYGNRLGVKQQSINERKLRILKKIKKFWGQPC